MPPKRTTKRNERIPAAVRDSKLGKALAVAAALPEDTDEETDDATNPTPVADPKPAKPARGPKKRKARDEEDEEEEKEEQLRKPRPTKKAKSTDAKSQKEAGARVKAVSQSVRKIINEPPRNVLDIFVFGEGSSGELGLGSKKYDNKKPIDVKRPRINHNLNSTKVGVVQIACGGMHVIALTKDNKIYTWGVNDDSALGRDTTWSGGTRDVGDEDSDSDDDDDDTGLNPLESTPGEVSPKYFLPDDVFTQVAATDSASFALTNDGRVYGWGTFRGSDGIIGFTPTIRVQATPMVIPGLHSIVKIACGSNHAVALDVWGKVYTWGSGGQFQLGRKATTRHDGPRAGLRPESCSKFNARKFAVDISAGSYHSFFIDNNKEVWGWGLNNYSQTGHDDDSGQDDAMVLMPRVIESLSGLKVAQIAGGEHHTVARTADGQLLTWGRIDGHQVGHPKEIYNEDNAVFDDSKRPRILTEPTPLLGINAQFVAAGTDTSFAIDNAGKAYSWGFSANYQTGQGTGEDVEAPKVLDNTAVKDRKIVWAGAGGQYSIIASESESPAKTNGVATNGTSS